MPKLDDVCETLRTHSNMLAQSRSEVWSDTPSPIDESVRAILTRGVEIVWGAVDLGISENPTVLGIVCRKFLELCISLHWVISSPARAQRYTNFAKDELERIALLQMKSGLLTVRSASDDSDQTEGFSMAERSLQRVSRLSSKLESQAFSTYTLFSIERCL